MISYVRMVKENGRAAFIRHDEIAAFAENEVKVDGKMTPCVTVLLRNNVAWHFPNVDADTFIRAVAAGSGQQFNVIQIDQPEIPKAA